jgi:hypothetical protein
MSPWWSIIDIEGPETTAVMRVTGDDVEASGLAGFRRHTQPRGGVL